MNMTFKEQSFKAKQKKVPHITCTIYSSLDLLILSSIDSLGFARESNCIIQNLHSHEAPLYTDPLSYLACPAHIRL